MTLNLGLLFVSVFVVMYLCPEASSAPPGHYLYLVTLISEFEVSDAFD